jgi:hypothetical protein
LHMAQRRSRSSAITKCREGMSSSHAPSRALAASSAASLRSEASPLAADPLLLLCRALTARYFKPIAW